MIDKKTHGIVIPVMFLICIGILMVYSSTSLMSTEKYDSAFRYLWRHLFTIIIGFIVMFSLAEMDYHKLRVFVIPLLVFSVILLILVFVPGVGVSAGAGSGVKRWIKLWPSTFQPSELVKVSVVLFLADYMDKNEWRMKNPKYGIIIPFCVVAVFQAIILLQPDFGAVMSLAILTVILLFLGGVRWRYLSALVLLSVPVIIKLVWTVPYRKDRLIFFLHPDKDALGKGFQLVQSFIAFGRGGIKGVGIGASKQKLFYLPELHTDFVFSIIGEELGLIGVSAVLALFIWFFVKGMKIAAKTEDSFGYYLATGLTMMIVTQGLINFAVSIGLMPTKGLPLPFISYGGSALFINMAAVGILINIQKTLNAKQWVVDRVHYPRRTGNR